MSSCDLRKKQRAAAAAAVLLLVLIAMQVSIVMPLLRNGTHLHESVKTVRRQPRQGRSSGSRTIRENVMTAPPTKYDATKCLFQMLASDVDSASGEEESDSSRFVPLFISPVMHGTELWTALLCSIDVPVRYVVIVLNSNDTDLMDIVEEMRQTVSSFRRPASSEGAGASRVTFIHEQGNLGFSGAMNTGIAVGARMPFQEVPWYLMLNSDVSFPKGFLALFVAKTYSSTSHDEPMYRRLESEIKETEESGLRGSYVPTARSLDVMRTDYFEVMKARWTCSSTDALLVTSQLLPDRLRYASIQDRRLAFTNHTGLFYLDYMSFFAFAASRLMTSTVGYLDENFFPAYFEDIDWRWRMCALGFQELSFSKTGTIKHNLGGTWKHANSKKENGYHDMLSRRGFRYQAQKYGQFSASIYDWYPLGDGYRVPFGEPLIPLDTWALDMENYRCVRTGMRADGSKTTLCCFNPEALVRTQVIPNSTLLRYTAFNCK